MKNLENYGVLEMNAGEIRKTDGGISILDGIQLLIWAYEAAVIIGESGQQPGANGYMGSKI
ncbi:MAG: hypothetical protein DRI95_14240 [Bacteroidetes bacterium]|nr:MAG: hypothetical protein DRI95_14240 [Bacteroidota bacterium]